MAAVKTKEVKVTKSKVTKVATVAKNSGGLKKKQL